MGRGRFFFSSPQFFLSFQCWIQVWEGLANDNWYYVDTAWWPHWELLNWKRNWGHSWDQQGGRMGRNFSLECVCVCYAGHF